MQTDQGTSRQSADAQSPRRTLRIRLSDRLEMVAAATEAEGICPTWIADLLSERERVAP